MGPGALIQDACIRAHCACKPTCILDCTHGPARNYTAPQQMHMAVCTAAPAVMALSQLLSSCATVVHMCCYGVLLLRMYLQAAADGCRQAVGRKHAGRVWRQHSIPYQVRIACNDSLRCCTLLDRVCCKRAQRTAQGAIAAMASAVCFEPLPHTLLLYYSS